ncbi:putative SOS response-associated peptidase YedK [mine drainage metagenome]|uniref:Putative SOS response-associated peptidase YedK n=1 Tax=mine drainage metagenome TaxID=410659 RepID=A0A1J5R7G6_9ZZZZ
MCGRYASFRRDDEIARALMVQQILGEERDPSWNVAPMQGIRVVLERPPREEPDAPPVRQMRRVRWGLVPSWAKDPTIGSKMINARSETLTAKPSFKAAAARRRCLVPMDGYYEWMKNPDDTKTPYFLHAEDEGLLAAAGLYELWPDPDLAEDDPKKWLWTATITTTSATDALGHIHDRTPVFIPPDRYDQWLDNHLQDTTEVDALLRSLPEPVLQPRQVGPAVGAVRNNGPQLIASV